MSRLSELIAELCPDGVEYKALGCLTTKLVDGSHKVPPKSSAEDALPMVSAQNVVNGKLDLSFGRFVLPDAYVIEAQRTKVQRDDVLLTIVGAIGRTAIVETDDVLAFQRSVCVITTDKELLEPRFLRYVLDSDVIQNYMTTNARGAAQKGFYLAQVAELRIPVPPIEVQREIVRILDSFQKLDDALTAEIEAREKQLTAMCDRFVCDEAFEQKTLGEVCQLHKGRGLQKKDFSESGIGCIHYGQIYTRFGLDAKETLTYVPEDKANSFTWVEPNDIVVAITSENVEDVCKSIVWAGEERIVTGAHAAVLRPKINPLYLAYCLRSHDFERQKTMIVDGVKVIEMKVERLSRVMLRVPSRRIQDDVVDKLESVRGLINEMKCERDVRCKQFAYYRDKLLSFPEMVTVDG